MSVERILTTHVGSLARPHALLDVMADRLRGDPYDSDAYDTLVRDSVDECVRRQAQCGIDIVGDGEVSKPGFYTYVRSRLAGFEPRPDEKMAFFEAEVAAFPEYYERYFAEAMTGGAVAPVVPLVCTAPVRYCGLDQLQIDIDNLVAAKAAVPHVDAFMPAVAPSGVGRNEFYDTEEEYFHAVGEALAVEYRAIVAAGLVLQVDDPFLTDIFVDPALDDAGRHRRAAVYVEAVNASLAGIPPERVRWHTCYGINEGPRIHEAAMHEVLPYMLAVNAGGYSFEAANPRHEHEYHLWETIDLPDDKVLIPGVITHASNIVEHPEYIAERLVRFARLVGRERVVAGADCGFSSQASYRTEVHPTVIWAKLEAMADGARLASEQLW